MELADKIDPAEVLAHLNQLGYKNISPPQLKEFIRDLKKLIVHDQLSSSSGSLTSLSSSASDFTYYSTSEALSDQSRKLRNGCNRLNPSNRSDSVRKKIIPAQNLFKDSTTSVQSGSTLKKSSSSSSSSLLESCMQKENLPAHKMKTKSICEEELQESVKPRTSFIRPWQLQGNTSGSVRTGRSDPVSLYHYYQTLWAQKKCPGEDSHADLRWVIREKMMGQDPHLYSQSVLPPGKRNNRMRL